MELKQVYPELVRALHDAGLDADRLEPWPAWKAFKSWLRRIEGSTEAAAYVEFGMNRQRDDFRHVAFVLQLAAWEPKLTRPTEQLDDRSTLPDLNVVREVVVDLAYEASDLPSDSARELASGEFGTLDDFIAAIEGLAEFQAAMAAESVGSLVYEDEV